MPKSPLTPECKEEMGREGKKLMGASKMGSTRGRQGSRDSSAKEQSSSSPKPQSTPFKEMFVKVQAGVWELRRNLGTLAEER